MTKYTYIAISVALIGMVLIVAITMLTLVGKTEQDTDSNIVTVVFNNASVYAETVSTNAERNRGLSGRERLEEGTGMLFIFPTAEKHSFWMPDMHFSIDIIWLDEYMKVVHIKVNATPESYPEQFAPPVPAKYVLEVPAGFSVEKGIQVGEQALVR